MCVLKLWSLWPLVWSYSLIHGNIITGVTCCVPLYTVKVRSTKQLFFSDNIQLYLSPKGNHSIVWVYISNLKTSKDLLLQITKAYTVFRTRQRLSVCHTWKLSAPRSRVLRAALISTAEEGQLEWSREQLSDGNRQQIWDSSTWWRESWGGNMIQAYKISKLVDKVNEELLLLKSCSARGNWEKNNLQRITTAGS